ncbi:MAG: nitrite reductase (NAD(P)H) small subunit [Armatimonadota bacterium]|nr:nitrite reductase (NAD(P)H) small subunit [Armatimonadota bacterium]MDR5697228.1 nitrite reductase (NAD(P)H) small subunit [Armatimonadota bacterium]
MGSAGGFTRAARLEEVQRAGCLAVAVAGHTVALFAHQGRIYAVDNRCPHMGFPLHRGSVHDGILTCHWHHARFDLATGGTFDLWADDVRTFPVEVRDGEVWVDVSPRQDAVTHQRTRLRDGLERGLNLVIAKAVIGLLAAGEDAAEPFRIGLEFGARHRETGWGRGLTTLACLMNLIFCLYPEDRARALYHGLSHVAVDCAGSPPRHGVRPLPGQPADVAALRRWFRRFVEVRDAEGAERCIVSAVRAGAGARQIADMLFAAATDHRYAAGGHLLDFTNKALEALDLAGWEFAEPVLGSLAPGYAQAERMEESNAWRHPIDLVEVVEAAFEVIPDAAPAGRSKRGSWSGREALVPILLGHDPQAIADALVDGLRQGATAVELAAAVSYAAALRVAHFARSNEFSDWDTALHTFTFANAVEQGLRRLDGDSTEDPPALLRGVFDAAMSVYLDRFLNVPPARLPEPARVQDPEGLLRELADVLDRQQQVDEAGALVADYLASGGAPGRLLAALGALLLREDRDFHTVQMIEAAFRQFRHLGNTPAGAHVLIAAARYLAAHAPTMRSQGQTFQIAHRLHRGERLYADP